jgi:predicted molibdopterin-dependent oxidoreductase YjgC
MGALDMGLGPRLRPGHGYDASCQGRDTLAQLEAMRSGEQTAVLLLGGGLLGNVLDVEAAVAALEAAKVIVVTGHGGRTLAHADVVLPAEVQHERHGTVTNIEGRVTNVTPKISAPGSAWNDVAIAAELAEQYGQSLGLDSVELCAKVIEETTGYPALSVMNDLSDEGAVVSRAKERIERRPLDPMAFPGIKSTNTVGLAEFSGALVGGAVTAASARPVATLDEVSAGRGVEVGHYDAYGLALNVTRRLYDHGIAVEGSPALANLVARTTAVINHFDLDRLGLSTGDVVQVNAPKGPLSLSVVLSDDAPRGTIGVVFGSLDDEGHAGTTAALYDPASVITQMKLETT